MSEEACPVCKADAYLNPAIRFLVSPCYHRVCEGCIGRLFAHGSAPCPVCGTVLRRPNWILPVFEDLVVERECRVRKRLAAIFNRHQEDFESLRAYNDYLEEVEDIVWNLVNDVNVQQMEAKLEAYRLQNQAAIQANNQKEAMEGRRLREQLAEEAAQRKRLHEEALTELQQDQLTRKQEAAAFLEALATSSDPAFVVAAGRRKAKAVAPKVEMPSALRSLKAPSLRRTPAAADAGPFDPLETVPPLVLPVEQPDLSCCHWWSNWDSFDPFEDLALVERMRAGGFTPGLVKSASWFSAFADGLFCST